jgi:hypothetical protein
LSNWRLLLSRTIMGLEQLEQQGQAVPEWVLGGGTALMVHANHRLSKDIDAFVDDPQYLGIMSPKVTEVWSCRTWDEAAHYLKLIYAEGEIDFIVSGPLGARHGYLRDRPHRPATGPESFNRSRASG